MCGIMTFSDFHCHTNPIFLELKLPKVNEIIKSQQLKLSYEFYKNQLPTAIQSLFQLVKDIHTYETNSATRQLLHISQIHTTSYGNKSLKYHCPTLWNSTIKNNIAIDNNVNTNIHIDSILNLHHFKIILKKTLSTHLLIMLVSIYFINCMSVTINRRQPDGHWSFLS